MRAAILRVPGSTIELADVPVPQPGPGQILVRVRACGICRTDLHVLDRELPDPKLPLVLGHQIVGEVVSSGESSLAPGTRVGIPWLGWTCGSCSQCLSGRENLCPNARFTGYTIDGGFAEYTVADARYCFPLPDKYSDIEAAPLLCAGLIGYRALRLCGPAERLGIYGFGAAAHIIAQVARYQGRRVFAFTREHDTATQTFARELGAEWAGGSLVPPPEPLDAAIIFASAGELVPTALKAVGPGGVVVTAGIHMTDIPTFPYRVLWEERVLRSVANLTRQDGTEFFAIAPKVPVRTTVTAFPLAEIDQALASSRAGKHQGSLVVTL